MPFGIPPAQFVDATFSVTTIIMGGGMSFTSIVWASDEQPSTSLVTTSV